MRIKVAVGFSLLEVLIAMALLAMAILSLVRLQVATLHAAREASALEHAHQLAAELAQWIRASAPVSTVLTVLAEQDVSPVISCYRQSCTPQQFARFEWHEWQQRVGRIAPAARISVCRSDHLPLADWDCAAYDDLSAPLVVRIGWLLQAQSVNFLPALAITIGPVPP